jgi:hypothetical protein
LLKGNGKKFGNATVHQSGSDDSFAYKNVFLTPGYHLVKHKMNKTDSLQIVQSMESPVKKKMGRYAKIVVYLDYSLVAFNKLDKRKMNPTIESKRQLLSFGDLGDDYLKKHTSSVDFRNMSNRNADKFLINHM